MENEQEKNEYIETLEDSLQATPEEAREFLWSNTYKEILEAILKKFNIVGDKKELLNSFIFDSITETIHQEDLKNRVIQLGIAEQDQELFFDYIYEYFIDIAAQGPQNSAELHKRESSEDQKITSINTSVNPFTSLQSRLTQSNMILPIKRDLSPDATPASIPTVPTKPSIDPYRELPEK